MYGNDEKMKKKNYGNDEMMEKKKMKKKSFFDKIRGMVGGPNASEAATGFAEMLQKGSDVDEKTKAKLKKLAEMRKGY